MRYFKMIFRAEGLGEKNNKPFIRIRPANDEEDLKQQVKDEFEGHRIIVESVEKMPVPSSPRL